MSNNENPLAGRGKAAEDAWIRKQEREAREKAKAQGNGGDKSGDKTNTKDKPAAAAPSKSEEPGTR